MKNLQFFLNLFPSGEGISYKVNKNPACRILLLRRVAPATYAPPPQCDNCFLPYGKKHQYLSAKYQHLNIDVIKIL